jgi:atlastin
MAIGHNHPYGNPESILTFTANNQYVIDERSLKKIFEHPDVKYRKIVAFSVVGAYRKGKSFLLGYALRYLYAMVRKIIAI